MAAAVLLLLTWLVASVPFGLVLSLYFADVDVREAGSGNVGATNVRRVVGPGLGAATLALDAAKGVVPVLAAIALAPGGPLPEIAALVAFAGHCWSPYLGFRGGRGVATAAGAMLALAPFPTLLAAAAWLGLVLSTRRASVGALVAAALLPLACAVLAPAEAPVALLLALGVAVRHRDNIRRLLGGTEPPVAPDNR